MFLARNVAWAGIVFLLPATRISGPRPTLLTPGAESSKEMLAVPHPNDVNGMQQTLLDKRHYRGKVDGVSGLRTRGGIHAYQKAENLPVTSRLDQETVDRLGVRPEVREEKNIDSTQDEPPAGTKWANVQKRIVAPAAQCNMALSGGIMLPFDRSFGFSTPSGSLPV
jgi:hypothetical protein